MPEGGVAYTLLSFEALLSGFSFPDEEKCRQLADELEENPPPDLTPEGLFLVLQILRGEGEEAKFAQSKNKVINFSYEDNLGRCS